MLNYYLLRQKIMDLEADTMGFTQEGDAVYKNYKVSVLFAHNDNQPNKDDKGYRYLKKYYDDKSSLEVSSMYLSRQFPIILLTEYKGTERLYIEEPIEIDKEELVSMILKDYKQIEKEK